jgi:thioredoxin reductase (NADPH)
MIYTDLLIVGAGPIGIACGLEAKKNDLNYIIIEKGSVANSILHYPAGMTFFSTAEKIEIDNIPLVTSNSKPSRDEYAEYLIKIVDKNKLNIKLFEKIIDIKKDENGRLIFTSNKNTYSTKYGILAIGFFDFPNLLEIEYKYSDKIKHYFDDARAYAFCKTAVIGGGNSATQAALELNRFKSQTTIIVRKNDFDDSVKYWIKPDIQNRIKDGEIKAYFNSKIISVEKNFIVINDGIKDIVIENDFVFALIGYRPDFDLLRKAGIYVSEKGEIFYNGANYETNVSNLYLAGVVCGGSDTNKWFIENSLIHAKIILNDINKKENKKKQINRHI